MRLFEITEGWKTIKYLEIRAYSLHYHDNGILCSYRKEQPFFSMKLEDELAQGLLARDRMSQSGGLHGQMGVPEVTLIGLLKVGSPWEALGLLPALRPLLLSLLLSSIPSTTIWLFKIAAGLFDSFLCPHMCVKWDDTDNQVAERVQRNDTVTDPAGLPSPVQCRIGNQFP